MYTYQTVTIQLKGLDRQPKILVDRGVFNFKSRIYILETTGLFLSIIRERICVADNNVINRDCHIIINETLYSQYRNNFKILNVKTYFKK